MSIQFETKKLLLFDLDGTLTCSRSLIEEDMILFLQKISKNFVLGLVGGSDLNKIQEQLRGKAFQLFTYVFSENGLVYHKNGVLEAKQDFKSFIGSNNLKSLNNFILDYISKLDIPVKTGTFIELRSGMLNVSPIGRNCNQQEREEFEKLDKDLKIREKMINLMKKEFRNINLAFSIGGQISFDIFPKNWNKTFCLSFLKKEGFSNFDQIYFFGDKTNKGGNDYEIFIHPFIKGFTVDGPKKTMEMIQVLFFTEFGK